MVAINYFFKILFQDEENEFDHFHDDEEFEGFESGQTKPDEKEAPKITITKVASSQSCSVAQPSRPFHFQFLLGFSRFRCTFARTGTVIIWKC